MKVFLGRKSPGISPLIATIILIAITVVGGVLVYTILTGYISRYSASDQVTVSAVELSVAPTAGSVSGPGILSISIKNSGTSDVWGMSVSLLNVSSTSGPSNLTLVNACQTCKDAFAFGKSSPLDSGLTASATFYVDCPSPSTLKYCTSSDIPYLFVVDGTYEYQVTAWFSDGSTYDATGTVSASP